MIEVDLFVFQITSSAIPQGVLRRRKPDVACSTFRCDDHHTPFRGHDNRHTAKLISTTGEGNSLHTEIHAHCLGYQAWLVESKPNSLKQFWQKASAITTGE